MAQLAERLVTAGKVVVMAPVGPEHGEKALRLGSRLQEHADRGRTAVVRVETGYWLAGPDDHVRAPDISAVLRERLVSETVRHGAVTQAPDLAVEITFPSDRDTEVQEKVQDYLDVGVSCVWVVRPELKSITVHRPDRDPHVFRAGDTLTSGDAGFPDAGFALELGPFFDD